jgi:cysteine desulfurase/selenocysteine lyase
MDHFLRDEYGTVHRGLYQRSVHSTALYEQARATVAKFLHAQDDEIIFTMGTTDAINLVAWSWGRANLTAGDRILVTGMEHHANIVPWQLISEITGAELIPIPILDDGSLDMQAYADLLDERVRFVGIVHIANSLGTINPVQTMIQQAHAVGAKVLVDAAQSAAHMPIDVRQLDCDFLAFSGHKMYGPSGIGVLYGKKDVLQSMPPWRGGGEMIEHVSFTRTTYAEPPLRFEAGTPPIVEAIGLAAALEWLQATGLEAIAQHEHTLFSYAEEQLATVPGLLRIGQAPDRASALSFVMSGAHAADVAAICDMEGIAIRAGHHCAQPVMQRFDISATARISIGAYTTTEDLDRATAALKKVANLFG